MYPNYFRFWLKYTVDRFLYTWISALIKVDETTVYLCLYSFFYQLWWQLLPRSVAHRNRMISKAKAILCFIADISHIISAILIWKKTYNYVISLWSNRICGQPMLRDHQWKNFIFYNSIWKQTSIYWCIFACFAYPYQLHFTLDLIIHRVVQK